MSLSRTPVRPYGWTSDASLGGGWIGAWGSHIIDFLRLSVGEIVDASAQLRTTVFERPDADGHLHRCTAEDGFSARLCTGAGITASIDGTSVSSVSVPSAITALGSTGTLEVVGDQQIMRRDEAGVYEEFRMNEGVGNLAVPMLRWAAMVRDAVRQGAPEAGSPTFADGLACRQVLDRLLEDSTR